MKNKYLILLILVISSFSVSGQKNSKVPKLGQVTNQELSQKFYENDSAAGALVLEEKGHIWVDRKNKYDFRTDIYKRIKIFNKSELELATVKINIFGDEKIKFIKAVTYNIEDGRTTKIHLLENKIFKKKLSNKWQQVTFTLPNIKEGCVIEYSYSVFSPYFKLDDWIFQSKIPKIKSDIVAEIPGNYKYNLRFQGYKSLDRDNSFVKRNCILYPGIGEGDCVVYEYGMDDIKAFLTEDFMLSRKNYIAKIIFEPVSFTSLKGAKKIYTQTWNDADRTLRTNFFDGQTSKTSYFEKNLPSDILNISDDKERAQKIYSFLQNRLNWNNDFWSQNKIKVKQVFQQKTGGVDGINLTLYNSLKAANIESYIVALSTRKNGSITKLFPSVSNFNYIIVKVIIEGQTYYLDATDKNLTFGEIPYRCLNGEGRVLDFEKESYWEEISPKYDTSLRNRIKIQFDEQNEAIADITRESRGYSALIERKKLNSKSEEEYLEDFETKNPDIEVDEFEILSKKEQRIKTSFTVSIPDIDTSQKQIRFSPFIVDKYKENPFKFNQRYYPIDLGYKWSDSYTIFINAPEGYELLKIPLTKNYKIPYNGGELEYKVQRSGENLKITMNIKLNRNKYNNTEYLNLKKFFKEIITLQDSYVEYIKESE
ncbi:hypothetical protein ACOSP6_13100 [Tenacibaculum sp. MEBiC06402]|uniref:hypothetical protein n=1 Tax=unclassified Tenacibaculum TaxID=2635139 RepID=UPI003B9AFF32